MHIPSLLPSPFPLSRTENSHQSVQTSPIDLPYEVWQNISSFLSVKEAWLLHGLNRKLRNIALDICYRCVSASFAPHHYTSYASHFKVLGNEIISGRVREVHLLSHIALDPFDFPGNQTRRKSLSLYLKDHSDKVLKPDRDSMIDTISRFTNVSSLHIKSTHDNFQQILQRGLPLIRGAIHTLSSNLRDLVLSYPLEMMAGIVPPDITFSRLESLEIGFSNPNLPNLSTEVRNSFENEVTDAILPFVSRHRQLLRSFKFCLPQYQQTFTPAPSYRRLYLNVVNAVFEGVGYMSRLESLSFSTPPTLPIDDQDHPIILFLNRHSKSLRELKVCVENMSFLALHDFMDRVQAPMPRMETLTLDFGFRARTHVFDHSPARFLRQYSLSLKTLKMERKQHGRAEVFSIFALDPGPTIVFSKLRHLEIWLYYLTPETLDLFSASLPALEDLDVTLRSFKGASASIKDERIQFCQEMQRRQYLNWRLQRLTLKSLDPRRKIVSNVDCICAMVTSLPWLLTINETSRNAYLRDPVVTLT